MPTASPESRARDGAPAPALGEALAAAIDLLRTEKLDEARTALEAILARWPEQSDALHFLGVLRHGEGRTEEGIALIRRAIAAMPTAHGPWNNLGNLLIESQRLDEALEAYRTSVTMSKGQLDSIGALNNIGAVHLKRQQWTLAEQACRDALALHPEFVDALYNLSAALMGQGRVNEALLANSKAITLAPRHTKARNQVISALLLLGEREQAAQLYRDWLAEEPDNPVVIHQLAACLGEDTPERASDAYVETVFDNFSASFDAKLESLHYRAPQLVADALRAAVGEPPGALDIVDAGCGTGLCGPLVKPWAKRLHGCDLSVGMLRKAKPRGMYDALHKAELVYYLDTQPDAWDVVISADTLCYFGELGAAMAAAHKCLRPGGWLIYTVEANADDDAPFRLQANGRYVHRREYLAQVLGAAGLELVAADAVELRLEAGQPVHGWLVTARRP